MGVHQATTNLQMNTKDTITSDQPYFPTSSHTEDYKNPAERDIITEGKLKNEVNNPLENRNQINISPNCETSAIGNRIRNPKRERRPDRAVYVPRHRRLNLSPSVNGSTVPSNISNIENDKPVIVGIKPSFRTNLHAEINEAEPIQQSTKQISQLCDIKFIEDNNSTNSNNISNEIKILSSNTNNNSYKCNNSNNISNNSSIFTTPFKSDLKSNENSIPIITESNNLLSNQNLNNFRIEPKVDYQYQRFEEIDNFKMQRRGPVICSHQELNNKDNSKIFKPVLECQLINDETTEFKSHSKLNKAYNTEIDDWDTLYDENGDCVAPSLSFSELTISPDKSPPNEKQKSDNNRHSRTISTEEFPHVLEVSNFPVEFKTQDIMMLFTSYKSSGFDIKWVDDTHALAIFSSSKIAAEVLSMNHPFVSLKPLPEATMASRNKARKCAELLQPYRQRPETCVALARRLVTGALGVKLKTSKEELENERRILRNAKEKRILAAKSRDEIWEDC